MPGILEVFRQHQISRLPSLKLSCVFHIPIPLKMLTKCCPIIETETCVVRAWSPDGGVMNVHQTMSSISQVSSQQSVSGRWVSNSSPSVSALSLRYYRHKHYHNIITGSLILHGMTETTLYRLTDADAVTIQKASPRAEAHVSQQRSEHLGGNK